LLGKNLGVDGSLAHRLREATVAHHASIERTLSFANLSHTIPVYRRVLGAFLGFYELLEGRLQRMATSSGDVDLMGREKVPLLRRDLRMLGASEEGLAALPRCPATPLIDGVPRALGCMYVLEGATLGGQIIARHLKAHLGIDERSGGSFFFAYGAEMGTMWHAFVARLNRQPSPFDSILAAATETFERLEAWLVAQGAPTWIAERDPIP
jgi:heme oxygenase (biliverdin-IX-beta and delta-forming)